MMALVGLAAAADSEMAEGSASPLPAGAGARTAQLWAASTAAQTVVVTVAEMVDGSEGGQAGAVEMDSGMAAVARKE